MVDFLPVTKGDLAAIAGIYNHYILNSTATFHSGRMDPGDLEEVLSLSRPGYPSFVIKDGDEVIGYCFLAQ